MKVSVIQLCASSDKAANLAKIENLVDQCVECDAPDLIVLPEVCAFISEDPDLVRSLAEAVDGPFAQAMARLAKRHGCVLHAGSMVERRGDRFFNTSLVFDREGCLIGRYSKIHRFDVTLPNGVEIHESAVVDRGEDIVVIDVDGIKIGLAICYDLRFSELFMEMRSQGASVIVLPAAFTFQTGADHWEILLRARAIETQCFIIAPDQVGSYGDGKYMHFAHGMIVDPWGLVIGQVSNQEGWASARLDMGYLEQVRTRLPSFQHRVLR